MLFFRLLGTELIGALLFDVEAQFHIHRGVILQRWRQRHAEIGRGRLLAFGVRERASGAGITFQIPIEAWLTATAPIPTGVVVNIGTSAEEAEEGMLCRTNHDADMPVPHHQVRRLRARNTLESFHSGVEIFRVSVLVGEAGALINRMHQVGTVVSVLPNGAGMKRHTNQGRTVLLSQCFRNWALRPCRSGLGRLLDWR